MIVLVFDTETTGLPKNMRSFPVRSNLHEWPHIVQLSYILYDTEKNTVVSIDDNIICLPSNVDIPECSTKIHGITNLISQNNGISIKEVLFNFIKDFELADLIVAHNLEFDKKMLIAEFYRLETNIFDADYYLKAFKMITTSKKYFCTMQESIDICNIKAYTKIDKKEYNKFPTLLELCKHLFQYEPKNLHNSMNDVVICLQCFYKMRFGENIYDKNIVVKDMIDVLK